MDKYTIYAPYISQCTWTYPCKHIPHTYIHSTYKFTTHFYTPPQMLILSPSANMHIYTSEIYINSTYMQAQNTHRQTSTFTGGGIIHKLSSPLPYYYIIHVLKALLPYKIFTLPPKGQANNISLFLKKWTKSSMEPCSFRVIWEKDPKPSWLWNLSSILEERELCKQVKFLSCPHKNTSAKTVLKCEWNETRQDFFLVVCASERQRTIWEKN